MAKFKEGSIVQVINPGCKAHMGCIGIVADYIAKDRISVDFGKTMGTVVLNECDLKPLVEAIYTGGTANVIEALKPKPIMSSTSYVDCLTDPNVDYEALSEEPVYYEFIDIGKALNKLKKYEHLGCKTSDSKEEELIYIINLRSHRVVTPYLVLKKEYNGRDLIKYTVKSPLGSQLDICPIDKDIVIFTKLKEALAYLELLNKIDEAEEIPF